jgi:Zn-dependent metalloprotease
MQFRKTLIAASLAALPMMCTPALAASTMMNGPAKVSANAADALLARLNGQRGSHGLDNDHGFQLAGQHPGARGEMIARVNHTYKGVRILGSESVIVTDLKGNMKSESIGDRRSGLGKGKNDLSVSPSLSAANAIAGVVNRLAPGGHAVAAPSAELIIYPVMEERLLPSAAHKPEAQINAMDVQNVVSRYELAYLVHTRMTSGNTPVMYDTVVSAADGSVLDQWSMAHSATAATGTGNSQYNGTVPVPVATSQNGTGYQMIDPTRGSGGTYGAMAITNADHTTSAGQVYTNTSNTWGDGQQYISGGSTTNANGQTAAVNALWGLMNTYDTLKNVLGWQSLDGHNTATYIAAHVNTAYDNAYYTDTCKCMYIGDGASFNSLGSIDVIGHEMSHGVTAATSNLAYRGESGGLNESSSDIGGEMVEAYARNGGTGTVIPATGNDWVMGLEISKTGTPLRYMYKPSKDGHSPDAWSRSLKRLDVHYSSGPNNRMFYFLAKGSSSDSRSDYYSAYLTQAPKNMTGIGSDKAYRIWFRANTTKFTSSTNYVDARAKVLAAAQELYGTNSAEAKAVIRAYAAINVGTDVAE